MARSAVGAGGFSWLPLDDDNAHWGEVADWSSGTALALFLSTIVADGIYLILEREYPIHGGASNNTIFGGLWLQAICPFLLLTVIVSLAREGREGGSRVGKYLRRPVSRWLGKISMSLYLVHHPILYYVVWGHNCLKRGMCGEPINVPSELTDCSSKSKGNGGKDDDAVATCRSERNDYFRTLTLPIECIPVVVVAALILATALFYAVEEPTRRCLRSKKSLDTRYKLKAGQLGGYLNEDEENTSGGSLLSEALVDEGNNYRG